MEPFMSKDYSIEVIGGTTITRFSKVPGFSDFVSAIQDVVKIDKHGRRLWDLSCGVDFKDATSDKVQKLAEIGKNALSGPGKAAIVAPEDFTFGIARMHGIYRKNEGYEIEVFRTEQEALDWLKKQPLS